MPNDIELARILLRVIGSPFDKSEDLSLEQDDIQMLYKFAKKNKLGLALLETLDRRHIIGSLEDELQKQRGKSITLQTTAQRAAVALTSAECKFAIIKSSYPFPAVPNDVDIIVFGGREEYSRAMESMIKNDFQFIDEAPLEVLFHDRTRSTHVAIGKDPFDVDLYREIGAGHVIYMRKNDLAGKVVALQLNEIKANTLCVPAELALSMFHSIFPERLFTLFHHYHILYSINSMSQNDIKEFLEICAHHKVGGAALLTLTISEMLSEKSFGNAPEKLVSLRESFGRRLEIAVENLPLKFSNQIILRLFVSKLGDSVFARSVIRQAISMLNPRYARYVASVYKEYRDRDTY